MLAQVDALTGSDIGYIMKCPVCDEHLLDNVAKVRGEVAHCGVRVGFSEHGAWIICYDPESIMRADLTTAQRVSSLSQLRAKLQQLTNAYRRDIGRNMVRVDGFLKAEMEKQVDDVVRRTEHKGIKATEKRLSTTEAQRLFIFGIRLQATLDPSYTGKVNKMAVRACVDYAVENDHAIPPQVVGLAESKGWL